MSRMDVMGSGPTTSREVEAVPALYTFDCRRKSGSPVCLEAYEFQSDNRALDYARKLLSEHATCSTIEVFDGERLVGTATHEPGLEDSRDTAGA